MAKEVIPQKVTISYNEEGTLDGILIYYKIRENGRLYPSFKSLSVKSSVDNEEASNILASALTAANTAEGIS